MATTVGDVIQGARDQHSSFDERRHPDRLLLRQLSGYHRRLCAKAVHVSESILATALTIPLPLTSFVAGYTLPAHQYLHGGDVWWTNGIDKSPLTLVPWAARNDAGKFPSGWVHGGVLYLKGDASDWTPYASLHLTYTPVAPEFTVLTQTLLLGDTMGDACEAFLAQVMAVRGHADKDAPRLDVGFFVQAAAAAEEAFLTDLFLRRGNQDNRIRDVRSFA
jgi:hypothetical protein